MEKGIPSAADLPGGPWTLDKPQYSTSRKLSTLVGVVGSACAELRASHADAVDFDAAYSTVELNYRGRSRLSVTISLTPEDAGAGAWVKVVADPRFGRCSSSELGTAASAAATGVGDSAVTVTLAEPGGKAWATMWVVQVGRALIMVMLVDGPDDVRSLASTFAAAAEAYR